MILHSNPWFRVIEKKGFFFVEEPAAITGAAVIVIWNDMLVLLEMDRVSQGDRTLEIPRGYGHEGEAACNCAAREVLEETGLVVDPDDLDLLGYVRPNTGILRSRVALYAAKVPAGTVPIRRDDEARGLKLIPMSKLSTALRGGMIEDGFTLSALALFQAR